MQPEKRIENEILAWLRMINVFSFKVDRQGTFDPIRRVHRKNHNPYKIRGVSDVLGCLPNGRMLAIEVKTSTGRLSPHQRLFIDRVNLNGGLAFVARSLDDVKEKLKGLINE